jgi:RNA polymerase sigma-70 factor (ECF subfamily)
MVNSSFQTKQLQDCLERLRAGDAAARDELLRHVYDRLRRLVRKMLKSYPRVKRWADTDDVLQNSLLRLMRALEKVPITSMRDFLALTSEQIRRELIDLARHYYGPRGLGVKHATHGSPGEPAHDPPDPVGEPTSLAAWCEFHQQVKQLPAEEQEVVGLLFYQELTQAEAAAILQVTVRTIQRRWQLALLRLHRILKDQ